MVIRGYRYQKKPWELVPVPDTVHRLIKLTTRDLRWFITHRSLQPCSSHMPDFRAHCGSVRPITGISFAFRSAGASAECNFLSITLCFHEYFPLWVLLEFSVLPHLHKNNLLSSGGWLNMLVFCRDRDCHRLLSQCVVYMCQNLQADFFAK